MKAHRLQHTAAVIGLIALAGLGGCATQKPPLYNWGPYESQMYPSFKNEAPEQQLQVLEQHRAAIEQSKTQAPPGFYAHLGLLYEKTGRRDQAVAMMEKEKQLFPESQVFMTRIQNTAQGK